MTVPVMSFHDARPDGHNTNSSSNVTETSATVFGRIDSNASGATYHFDYGTSTAYGSQAPTPDTGAICINCAEGANTIASLTGLTPGHDLSLPPRRDQRHRHELRRRSGRSRRRRRRRRSTATAPATSAASAAEITGSASANGVCRRDRAASTTPPTPTTTATAADPYNGTGTRASVALPANGVITIPLTGLAGNATYDYAVEVSDCVRDDAQRRPDVHDQPGRPGQRHDRRAERREGSRASRSTG